jgi:hypothetical protein
MPAVMAARGCLRGGASCEAGALRLVAVAGGEVTLVYATVSSGIELCNIDTRAW